MTTLERTPRILVVDEEPNLTHLLSLAIELEGWSPRVAHDGSAAIVEVARFEPDIILIDIGLPDVPGTEVITFLRSRGITTPAVFLTGRDSHEDRAAAYSAGGDGYVTKPFGLEEIIDYLAPIVSRLGLAPTSQRVGDLVLDSANGHAWRGEQFIPLTPLEFEMLHALAQRPGARMTIGQLIRATAARGVRVPRDFADRILDRVRTLINGDGAALVHVDESGWMLAGP